VVKERRIVEKTKEGNKLERLKDLDYIGFWGGVWMDSRIMSSILEVGCLHLH
jgi:hypothetical protein